MVSANELQRISDIRDHVDSEVLSALSGTCEKYSKGAQELAQHLKDFLERKEQNILSLDELGTFEQFLMHGSKVNVDKRIPLQDTNSPDSAMKKRSGNFQTPGENKSAKVEAPGEMKSVVSPASASLSAVKKKSGEAYKHRKGKNEITKETHADLGTRGDFEPSDQMPLGLRSRLTFNENDFENVPKRYKFMFTTLEERAKHLDKHLIALQEHMVQKNKISDDEISAVGIPSPEDVWVCGRICCESATGSINKQSVLLEGSLRDSGGRRIKLELSEVPAMSLFPGQIVMAYGVCSSGRSMVVKKLVEGEPLERPKSSPKKLLEYHHSTRYQGGKALSVMTAAGPFTTADNLDYAPFEDFLGKVGSEKPDLVVLLGPFVDSSQPIMASGEMVLPEEDDDRNVVGEHAASFEMVFVEKVIRDGVNALFDYAKEEGDDLPTHFVLVPSLLDGHHECVFPQPPFGDRERVTTPYFKEPLGILDIKHSGAADVHKRVHLMPNPCMFRLNEVLFGASSMDAMFNLSQDKIMEKVKTPMERFAGHLLQQHSFSPQFPPPPKSLCQLDLRHMRHWTMKASPDVLIVPSKLGMGGYITNVMDTLVLNPGTLARGETGGTYSEMHIHPMPEEELKQHVTDDAITHDVSKRTHTKVIRI